MPPVAVGLLAVGVYGLLVMAYSAYAVAFRWNELVALEEARGDVPHAAALMALLAWAIGSMLLLVSFGGLGLSQGRTAVLVTLHTLVGVALIVVAFVASLDLSQWQVGFLVDAALLFAGSIVVAGVYRRWGAWLRGVAVALFAGALLAINAYLLGGSAFEYYWLVGLMGVLAFVAAWLWGRATARG